MENIEDEYLFGINKKQTPLIELKNYKDIIKALNECSLQFLKDLILQGKNIKKSSKVINNNGMDISRNDDEEELGNDNESGDLFNDDNEIETKLSQGRAGKKLD